MTRVLVVDDSQFMRTVIGTALADAGYTVTTATNGSQAIEAVAADDPDIVTMDVEMPKLDGIDAVERIMATNPTRILMLSAYTDDGAEATLDALERGAVDFLHKFDTSDLGSRNIAQLADEVVAKVDELADADVSPVALARAATAEQTTSEPSATANGGLARTSSGPVTGVQRGASSGRTGPGPIPDASDDSGNPVDAPAESVSIEGEVTEPTIVIGASTGGPKIVEQLLTRLPVALGARVLVVQHMPESFTSRFADRLDTRSEYDIFEAADGDRLSAGAVAVAPGDAHLGVAAEDDGALELRLDATERIHGVRPAIDVTMTTAAEQVEAPVCGVALTGMGRDGAAGIEAINAAGGYTIAQNEATSPVFGIPCQAIETGCVDDIVAAGDIVDRIVDAYATDGETDD